LTETIIGNYRIEERIGRGGMGIVYRGHHLKLPREVAIKSISASSHRDLRHLRSRFEKEAFVQSQLDHPGIVKIYDYIVAEQTYYIVMEFVEGRSLAQLLERERGALLVERALDLF
jgi:serine/threonine protein kinase